MVIVVRGFIYWNCIRLDMGKLIQGEDGNYEWVYTSEEYHAKVGQLLEEKTQLIYDKYDYAAERMKSMGEHYEQMSLVWFGLSLGLFLMGMLVGIDIMA